MSDLAYLEKLIKSGTFRFVRPRLFTSVHGVSVIILWSALPGPVTLKPMAKAKMLIAEIQSPEECADEEIRARATESPKAPRTRHYLTTQNGVEAGFLSLDIIPGVDYLVLYELFVPTILRRRGIGSRLLTEVEKIATEAGYTHVNLTPSPLEANVSAAALVRWYKARGYSRRPDCPSELQKTVG